MQTFILPNGFRVFHEQMPIAGTVAAQLWINVGSMHEQANEFGMAHFIEHMVFKGSEKFGVGEISQAIEHFGGDINAYTTFDHTVLHANCLEKYSGEMLEVLLQAAFRSQLDEHELNLERQVILEEIARNDDDPHFRFGAAVLQRMFEGTSLSRPITGSEDSLKRFERKDLQQFYHRWYQPDNAFLVVVGKISVDELKKYLSGFFHENLSMKELGYFRNHAPCIALPERSSSAFFVMPSDLGLSRIEVSFSVPEFTHEDSVALSVVAYVLGQMESAILSESLCDQLELASQVSASVSYLANLGLFSFSLIPAPGKTNELIQELSAQLNRFRNQPVVDAAHLQAVRAAFRVDRALERESFESRARAIGSAARSNFGVAYMDYLDRALERLTPEVIHSALQKWLDPQNALVSVMSGQGEELSETIVESSWTSPCHELIHPQVGQVQKLNSPTVQRFRLRNGMKVLILENNHIELTSGTFITEGGLRSEKEDAHGHQYLFASLLGEASVKTSPKEMSDRIQRLGAFCGGFSGKDSMGLRFQSLNDDFEEFLPLVAETLREPFFPNEKFRSLQRQVLQTIACEGDDPATHSMLLAQRSIFAGHPYGRPVYGDKRSIEGASAVDLTKCFQEFRDEGPWTLGVVTGQPTEKILEGLEKYFGDWEFKSQDRIMAAGAVFDHPPESLRVNTENKEQTHVVLARKGLAWCNQDRYSLDLLVTILGGSGGRLFIKLREQRGLAYSVAPIIMFGREPGILGVYFASKNAVVEEAVAAVLNEIQDLATKGPSSNELDRAINYLAGAHQHDLQRSDSLAMNLVLAELFSGKAESFLDYTKFLEEVTPHDIANVAARFSKTSDWACIRVGP
jgi:zinc protease